MTETDADKLRKEVREMAADYISRQEVSRWRQACRDGFFDNIGALDEETAGKIVFDELQRVAVVIRSMK